jgi:outer membrane protein insertion porin family
LNNVKVLIALLGVWKNLRIKKVRLSPTFVTILVTSLSCNLALSAKAETHSQNLVQEINSQTTISSVKQNFLARKNYEILANQGLLEVKEHQIHLQTNSQQLVPSCQLKVVASTLRCNSHYRSPVMQYLMQHQERDLNTANYAKTLTQIPTEEIPTEETPTRDNQIPTEEIPTEETPTRDNQIPTEETPTRDNQIPTEETPTTSEEPRVLVAEVAVIGVEDELEDIVYETIDTEPGRTTTRSQLQEDINAVYATGLFQNIEVTPEDTPLGVRITITVEANPILSKVVVNTIPPDSKKRVLPPEKIEEFFGDRYGEILNLRDLQQGIKQINQWYSENGYELAQVVGSPQVSPDGTVTLVVAEGVIEDIQVRFFDEEDEPTDGKTRDFIVTREIELKSGDIFKRDTAQRDLQRVFGLGIFEDVRLSFSPGQDPSKVIVNVDVVESSTGSVAAGAGFSSSSGLFGTVSYQQKNLGGNNQTLGTELQLGERELLFDVSFTDPWIAGDRYRTSYTVNAFRRRSISLVFDGDDEDIRTEQEEDSPRVVRTGGGVSFSRPLSDNPFKRAEWTLSTGFQYQHVDLVDDDGNIAPTSREEDGGENLAFSDSGKDDLFIFRFGATQDRRNNRIQPTKGSLLRVGMEQTAPIGSGSILFNRVRANYSYYIPINLIRFTEGPQAFAFNVQGGTVLGDLPPYEAFVMGGSNSIRGFAEGEVGNGRSYFQASAEYRFPIFRIVGGTLFFDYGTVLGTDDNVPGEPSIKRGLPGSGYGYGIGVRVQSPLGPIRVDYGINDDGDQRINFGIGERF